MIAFSCPECDAELEVSDNKAGTKVACPECGRRMLVPAPAQKTADPRIQRGTKPPPPVSTTKRPQRSMERDEPAKRPQGNKTLLIAGIGGGIVVLLLAGVVVALLMSSKKETTSRADNGSTSASAGTSGTNSGAGGNATNPQADNKSSKPEEGKNAAKATGEGEHREKARGTDLYPHVLKSLAWVVVNVPKRGQGSGSGTLVDRKNRLVLTNHHVVDSADQIRIFFPIYENEKLIAEKNAYLDVKLVKRSEIIKGTVLASDQRRDLALVVMDRDPPDGIDSLPLSRKSVVPLQDVWSFGSPGAGGTLWQSVTGTVRGEPYKKQWQSGDPSGAHLYTHDAMAIETQVPTNPGDSGGPLVNDRGELVGVTHGFRHGSQLLTLFIDVSEARQFIEETCRNRQLTFVPGTRVLTVHTTKAVADLIQDLQSSDARVRAKAAQALGTAGPEARYAVKALISAVRDDKDDLTRKYAQEALNEIGPPDKSDLRLLKDALKDRSLEVRSYAATAIGKLGPDARSAVPDLVQALKDDKEAIVRQSAARSLGRIGTDSKPKVFPPLYAALKDPEKDVRVTAAEAITEIGQLSAADVPALVDILKQPDPEVRICAARALERLGKDAKGTIANLIEAAKGANGPLRRAIIDALLQLGADNKTTIPVFVDALDDSDRDARRGACQALAKFGPEAKKAAAAKLAEVLSDVDKDVRKQAAIALGKMGPLPKEALLALVEAARDEDKDVRDKAFDTLGGLGPDAKAAIPKLIGLFKEKDREIGRRAAITLGKIGKEAVPELVKALDDPNRQIRLGAIRSLGEIGPDAKSAIKYLLRLKALDPDPEIQLEIDTALERIRRKD